MAHIFLVCSRETKNLPSQIELDQLASLLAHSSIREPTFDQLGDNSLGIRLLQPGVGVSQHDRSVCLGDTRKLSEQWWKPGNPLFNGTYAMYRADEETLELASDIVASRTIWWAQTDELFIASSMQRAVIYFLTNFNLNPQAVTWLLATGNIGPSQAWDRRIQCVAPDSRVLLNRKTWQISIETEAVTFDTQDLPVSEYKSQLKDHLQEIFVPPGIDEKNWMLLLSGGVDSRAIAYLLATNGCRPHSLTWGPADQSNKEGSDIFIAQQLATHLGLKLEASLTDGNIQKGDLEKVFQELLESTEGRVEHLAGIWSMRLYEDLRHRGYTGFIRGDEGFGWNEVTEPKRVWTSVGIRKLSDIMDDHTRQDLGLEEQFFPETFNQLSGESLSVWRDRLYHQYRIPTELAALSCLWQSHLETLNPLLSRSLILFARSLPDELRTNKHLFREIVAEMIPEIPFASVSAPHSRTRNPTAHPLVCDYLCEQLDQRRFSRWLPAKLLRTISDELFWERLANTSDSRDGCPITLKLKRAVRRRLRPAQPFQFGISPGELAGRAFVICRSCENFDYFGKLRRP